MPTKLHIDIETYSSVDLKTSGAYKYAESIDFEVLMLAYAFDDEPVQIVDLARGEETPEAFRKALWDPNVEKWAHNAAFERVCFRAIGLEVPIEQWQCSAVKAAYCGLPVSLEKCSAALDLQEKGKLSTGRALIKYFSMPCKPTKANGQRHRNLPKHDLEKWEEFKRYCVNDVVAEREIGRKLSAYSTTYAERQNYILDQEINDRGILIDQTLAENAVKIDQKYSETLRKKMADITGLDNPNSPAQLKKWLSDAAKKDITTLAKDAIPPLIEELGPGPVSDVLELRLKAAKTSIKKYIAMLSCTCDDGRAHGLFQFYGSRTGRWAGRLIQLQNLPQNHLDDLDEARDTFRSGDYRLCEERYPDISSTLSQLIRTAFVAREGYTFAVADFSAIEARVIAWLAGEEWRLEVFRSHGKIYEASAEMMFDLPAGSVKKGSPERAKGKVAELALGYQGAVGALKTMGGEAMGLSEPEMQEIVNKWRTKNPKIKELWGAVEEAAIKAVQYKKEVRLPDFQNLTFDCDRTVLTITLPSGRQLFYQSPSLTRNQWDRVAVKYRGLESMSKRWTWIDTYGGKLVENIVQAIARDLLADALRKVDMSYDIVMHVHDELVAEVPADGAGPALRDIEKTMSTDSVWAPGLPLDADGYLTPFYKKD